MRIVTFKRIKEFSEKNANSKTALHEWYHSVNEREWENLNELKRDFKSVDNVGNHRFVFNIKGNNYRLIAIISFNAKKVYIRFIVTHSVYEKIQDIKNI